jgi:hypothetical protein
METKATYEARAEECLRLADLTTDDLIQTTLLRLSRLMGCPGAGLWTYVYLRNVRRIRLIGCDLPAR